MSSSYKEFSNATISGLQLEKPLLVQENDSLLSCIEKMQEAKKGCVLVQNAKGSLAGILTERLVLKRFVGSRIPGSQPVSDVMRKNPVVLYPDMELNKVVSFFGETAVHYFPVCDAEGKILGLLNAKVLVRYMLDHFPKELLNLPPKAGVIAEDVAGG